MREVRPVMQRADLPCVTCKEPIVPFVAWLAGEEYCLWCKPRECECCGREWRAVDDPEFQFWFSETDVPDACFACRQDPDSEPLVAAMEERL